MSNEFQDFIYLFDMIVVSLKRESVKTLFPGIIIIINPRLLTYVVPQIWSTLHSICTHIHSHIRKNTNNIQKQKNFNLQPLRASHNLAQHLQVSMVWIHPTPPHTDTSRTTSFTLYALLQSPVWTLRHEIKIASSQVQKHSTQQ